MPEEKIIEEATAKMGVKEVLVLLGAMATGGAVCKLVEWGIKKVKTLKDEPKEVVVEDETEGE